MTALPELKSPISAARIIESDAEYEEYSHQVVERGKPEYIMGRSDLLDFARCPHKWLMGYASEETDATEWGQLFEALVMYPDTFDKRFAVPPAVYPWSGMKCPECGSITDSKSCRKCGVDRKPVTIEKPWDFNATFCSDWKDRQKGKTIIKSDTETQARNAVKFFNGKESLRELVRCSKRQVWLEGKYVDKTTEIIVPLHGLVDLAPDKEHEEFGGSLADLKTTKDADPFSWARDVHRYGLHVQAALYLDLWNAATGEGRQDFRHAISESGPPWETACRVLSQDFITLGRMKYKEALERYCQCLKTGYWPGYDTEEKGTVWQGWLICEPEAWMIGR